MAMQTMSSGSARARGSRVRQKRSYGKPFAYKIIAINQAFFGASSHREITTASEVLRRLQKFFLRVWRQLHSFLWRLYYGDKKNFI